MLWVLVTHALKLCSITKLTQLPKGVRNTLKVLLSPSSILNPSIILLPPPPPPPPAPIPGDRRFYNWSFFPLLRIPLHTDQLVFHSLFVIQWNLDSNEPLYNDVLGFLSLIIVNVWKRISIWRSLVIAKKFCQFLGPSLHQGCSVVSCQIKTQSFLKSGWAGQKNENIY